MVDSQTIPTQLAANFRNISHSIVLVGSIGAVTALCAYTLWGSSGVVWSLAALILLPLLSPRIGPEVIIRMYGAQRVSPGFGASLLKSVEQLARRAELPVMPKVYVIPSPILNAFATGTKHESVIAVTHGTLTKLSPQEITGVIAHELAHIQHNDLWVMNLADTLSRFTYFMSMMGVLLFLLNLPLVFFGIGQPIPWIGIVLLYFAPTISNLLQLGLSRAREYSADLEGARLSGDPEGLASALTKIERYQGGVWEKVFMPGRKVPVPSILRTHPSTEERIARLLALRAPQGAPVRVTGAEEVAGYFPPLRQRPSYRYTGLWY